MIVIDTATLLYWTLDPTKLSRLAELQINQSSTVVASAISVWEIGIKVKKGKLELPRSFDAYVKALKSVRVLTFTPVDVDIWAENVALDWTHRDPADRTIVATAKRLSCPLVTPDTEIRAFYSQAIW